MDLVERFRPLLGQAHHLRLANVKALGFEMSDDLASMPGRDRVGFNDGQRQSGAHNLSFSSGTTSAGRFITLIPAFCNAAIFSAAVPDAPEMIAPACPMRRPGGAVWPAMNPTTGFFIFSLTNSAASCSSVPPISPIMTTATVSGSASKADRQ